MLLSQGVNYPEDLVVCLALGQTAGQGVVEHLCLEKKLAFGLAMPGGVEQQAIAYVAPLVAGQYVKCAAGLARIACHFGCSLFMAVEFLQNNHRQKNIMFFKAEQAHRVMQKHIGVEHKQLWRPAVFGFAAPVGAGRHLAQRSARQCCQAWRCWGGLGSVARQLRFRSGFAAICIRPKLPV